jgi:hypothetical protein
MGRKQSDNGLLFYTIDSGIYDDSKMIKLLDRYGLEGSAIYLFLINICYRHSYYYEFEDEDSLAIMIRKTHNGSDITIDRVKEIIHYMLDISLFDKNYFENNKVLTSKGLQARYHRCARGTKWRKEEEYLTLSKGEIEELDAYSLRKANEMKRKKPTGEIDETTGEVLEMGCGMDTNSNSKSNSESNSESNPSDVMSKECNNAVIKQCRNEYTSFLAYWNDINQSLKGIVNINFYSAVLVYIGYIDDFFDSDFVAVNDLIFELMKVNDIEKFKKAYNYTLRCLKRYKKEDGSFVSTFSGQPIDRRFAYFQEAIYDNLKKVEELPELWRKREEWAKAIEELKAQGNR